ncbi:MAG: hypothetical protein ABEK12_00505 [Candidatus Nanohaloarchaea archaeon]
MNQGYGGGHDPHDGEPVTVDDPTTGFHPDQLTAYPLQRVGTRLYVAHVNAVAGEEPATDTLMIDVDRMDAYAFGDLSPDQFDRASIRYNALDPPTRQGIPEKAYRGVGELRVEDFNEYETATGETLADMGIASVLMTETGDDQGLREIGRQLDDGTIRVEVLPDTFSRTPT